jgi:glycosyltransferase involved in cell wall biosynthesis
MLKGQRITLIAIAYNEEKLIVPTIKAVPDYVDTILIVDDCSTDSTPHLVKECVTIDPRVHIIRHKKNRGPGGAIISGYLWFYQHGDDIAVVVGGDNQMNQNEMSRFIKPIVDNVDAVAALDR